jgi:hypothetical protein
MAYTPSFCNFNLKTIHMHPLAVGATAVQEIEQRFDRDLRHGLLQGLASRKLRNALCGYLDLRYAISPGAAADAGVGE